MLAGSQVVVAANGRDREARRHGDAEARRVQQIGAFAAEEAAHAVPIIVQLAHHLVELAEQVDIFLRIENRFRPGCHGGSPHWNYGKFYVAKLSKI
jgi:hypothetical protein